MQLGCDGARAGPTKSVVETGTSRSVKDGKHQIPLIRPLPYSVDAWELIGLALGQKFEFSWLARNLQVIIMILFHFLLPP